VADGRRDAQEGAHGTPRAAALSRRAGRPRARSGAAGTADAKAQGAARGYVLEDQVGFLLRCAHQRATEVFYAVMAPFAVTPTQFAALAKLDDLGSVSQNRLGRLTAMDPATISGVVGRLIARGLVRPSRSRSDARLVRLALTPAGRAATARMKAAAAEVSRRTLTPLAAGRARALLRALAQIG
jgi:DNA-binding MarR family transcriptional regulator